MNQLPKGRQRLQEQERHMSANIEGLLAANASLRQRSFASVGLAMAHNDVTNIYDGR